MSVSKMNHIGILLLAVALGLGACQPALPGAAPVPSNTAPSPVTTASVTSAPSATEVAATEAATSEPAGKRFTAQGVSFVVAPAVASSATAETVPEVPASENGPYWEVNPEYLRISLEGYPLQETFFSPVISVYPVEAFKAKSPPASAILEQMKIFLAEKPATADQIPFLPIFNAAQVFHSNLEYLDFQNGSGVRFLTEMAQYPAPVNNYDLFYTFQGLTSDGRYMVSMILPVNHPNLPSRPDSLSTDALEAMTQRYDQYRAEVAAELEAQPASSFTPDLDLLDAMVKSLEVEGIQ